MSLLDAAMERCVLLEKDRTPDGEGGFIEGWRDGAEFMAAITYDASLAASVAAAQGVKNRYTITTRKNAVLDYNDVFKRVKDGKVFRVKTDGEDNKTPDSASLNMRQVTAEEWALT